MEIDKENVIIFISDLIDERNYYKARIDTAIEELELWNPKIEILKIERDALINILRGNDE